MRWKTRATLCYGQRRGNPSPTLFKYSGTTQIQQLTNPPSISGGRRLNPCLVHSDLTYQAKHLVILHHSSPVVKLMVHHLHVSNSLPSYSLYSPGSRRLTRAISRTCVICQRSYAHPVQQQLGELPPECLKPSPPFTSTGIDFAGPFTKRGNIHKPTYYTSYACLFCLSTRAIDIEGCSNLSTEASSIGSPPDVDYHLLSSQTMARKGQFSLGNLTRSKSGCFFSKERTTEIGVLEFLACLNHVTRAVSLLCQSSTRAPRLLWPSPVN